MNEPIEIPENTPTAQETISALGDAVANFLEFVELPVNRNIRVEELKKTPVFNALTAALFVGVNYMEGLTALQFAIQQGVRKHQDAQDGVEVLEEQAAPDVS